MDEPSAFDRQAAILERIATNAPLAGTLELLVELIEAEVPGTIGSVLLVDPVHQTLHVVAARGLPAAYNAAIEGVRVGPDVGSCGTAAHQRALVITADIETDPRWDGWRMLARPHGLRACWSSPIVSRRDPGRTAVLGTFALYCRAPAAPDALALQVLARAEFIACIAIESSRASGERRRLEVALAQAQRLEAIGRLAGGIAHDFNNLITVINAYTEVLLEEGALDGTARQDVEVIRDAGARAAALTAQLLAYVRRDSRPGG